jgi:hypothetical protein
MLEGEIDRLLVIVQGLAKKNADRVPASVRLWRFAESCVIARHWFSSLKWKKGQLNVSTALYNRQ